MKLLSLVALLSAVAFHNVYAGEGVDPEPVSSSTTIVPTTTNATTTSTTPTPSSTTAPTTSTTAPTTSTTTTTSSTPASTTSTPSPTTSTSSPTTSTPSPTTSTPSPTTSTAGPTSPTTPQPTPPGPTQGTWKVNSTTNNTACILLKMAATLDVNYTDSSNKTEEAQIYIPINATSTGSCGDANHTQQSIKLKWSMNPNSTDTLEFIFNKTDNKFDLDVINVNLTIDPTSFPNAKDANKSLDLVHRKINFVTPVQKSYRCEKEQTLPLYVPGQNVTIGSIKISQFQFEAFNNITNEKFAEAEDCAPYETPDIVPIAVGCALMALIIIVLIGYLIGRRRNQARGYLSMFTETKNEADYIPMKNLSCFQ